MKWNRLPALALAAAILCAAPVRASFRTVPVQVDGAVLEAGGHLDRGVTYVPLRTLLDALGGWELSWDSGAGQAVATSAGRRLTADPAKDTVRIDGRSHSGRVYIHQGRTYIPLRLVAGALGSSVQWDPYLGGAAVTSPDAEHNAADLYWLSRIISAESRGEPLRGQIAVGNVVLNRVASREFPDTIPAVVFDRTHAVQFEPVQNGTVYHPPAELSVEAARQVLRGAAAVDGALYFYAPALSPGTWIAANRTYLTTIGCHRFYL